MDDKTKSYIAAIDLLEAMIFTAKRQLEQVRKELINLRGELIKDRG